MSLLFSNYPPVRTEYPTYTSKFKELLRVSDHVKIATGYISSDSAIDLKNVVEANGGPNIDLCIGMHYFEGFSPLQKEALDSFNYMLVNQQLGGVYLVTTFPFHGKIVSFINSNNVIGSIIGSSNMSNIIGLQRQYEADYLFEPGNEADELKSFIVKLIDASSKPLQNVDVKIVHPDNNLLADQLGVEKVTQEALLKIKQNLSNLSFSISLKGDNAPKSGLNVYFGEGRRNLQGFVMPRPWYEVELIVPKAITQLDGYPRASSSDDSGVFNVITDDGWTFKCKVSGDYSKNFRSEDDLKILGKWLKGRLENAGILKPGQLVTNQTFEKYGRSDIRLTKINSTDSWFLDFGVNNE